LVVIYIVASVGSIGSGWLSGFLLRRGWSVNASRKSVLLVCALSVVPVFVATQTSNIWVATILISFAAAAHMGWAANLFAMVADMFPKQVVASVVGLGVMFGAVSALLFAQLTGFILQTTGRYWPLFAIASSAYLLALAVIHALIPRLTPAELKAPETILNKTKNNTATKNIIQ